MNFRKTYESLDLDVEEKLPYIDVLRFVFDHGKFPEFMQGILDSPKSSAKQIEAVTKIRHFKEVASSITFQEGDRKVDVLERVWNNSLESVHEGSGM
ncbi:hypothetical protein KC842_02400 [Candidatus Nomurabacteria bacterium]|nr:hypothetical protein [Candidatus Nomurabacteria bacterium]USN95106.1 MAG: hypothetical protein H6791_01620 [Candidatus Nomurabacteria bacterium]